VHRNNILIYIQQDATLPSLFCPETVYTFRVVPSLIIRSATNCIYSMWYLSHRYCYLPLSWKWCNRFECAVGGVRHPQHTHTSSNTTTIALGSSNGVTNTRCCRYSWLRFWWWVMVPSETYRQFADKINCVMLHLFGYILEFLKCPGCSTLYIYNYTPETNNVSRIFSVYSTCKVIACVICVLHQHFLQ